MRSLGLEISDAGLIAALAEDDGSWLRRDQKFHVTLRGWTNH